MRRLFGTIAVMAALVISCGHAELLPVVNGTLSGSQPTLGGQIVSGAGTTLTAGSGSYSQRNARLALVYPDRTAPSVPTGAWSFTVPYTLADAGGGIIGSGALTVEKGALEERFETVALHPTGSSATVTLAIGTVTSP